MKSHLAVFDLDETLVAGDSMSSWHEYLVEKGFAASPDFLKDDQIFMQKYADGTLQLEPYLAFSLSPLSSLTANEVDALAEAFVHSKMRERVFPQAQLRLKELRAVNAKIVIISASLSFLVAPLARYLGVDMAMGIDLCVENGKYIPVPEGIPTFREGKVQRLANWLHQQEIEFEHISFYTDSINDLPMCMFADEVFVVNPCSQLFKKAGEHQWPVLKWGQGDG